MNYCEFVGRLSRDPEVQTVNTTKGEVAVCNFGLAVTKTRKARSADVDVKEVAFIECEAWDKGGLAIAKHYRKGAPIKVEASVRTSRYTDAKGQTRISVKFRVNRFANPEMEQPPPESSDNVETQPEEVSQPF